MGEHDFLTINDIADILRIHYNTANNYVRKQMTHVKYGRCYRVSVEAFNEWLASNERRINGEEAEGHLDSNQTKNIPDMPVQGSTPVS